MSANPSGFGDTFGNMGAATSFGSTNALATTNTASNPLGPIESFSGGAVVPTSNTGVAAPAATPHTVGLGGSGVNGAPSAAGASAGSSAGFDWGSILGNLGSDVSSFLNSPLGSLAEFTALYKVIANQAADTQKQNNDLAGKISAIGQPDVTAGKNMLDAYTSGQLTAPFQGQVDAAKYQDQQTATSQTQQVASALANAGGQNMQSAQISQSGQINAQRDQADRLAVSNAFLAELSASLNLTQTGGAFVQAGIVQEIQSNTQLQAQLADLMGSLAKAYSAQTANSGKGGSSSDSSLSSTISDVKNLWDEVKGLFGSKGSGWAAGQAAAIPDAGAVSAAGIGDIGGAAGLPGGAADLTGAASVPALPVSTFGGAGAGAGAAGAGAAGAGAAGAGAAGAGAGITAESLGVGAGADLSGALNVPALSDSAFGSAGAGSGAGSGLASTLGAGLGYATIAYAGASMIHDMTGHGDSVGLNGVPLAPGVTKTTTTGGQGALQVGNMVYGLGSMGKEGGSMNWFVKGADGKQKWVGADANAAISAYAARGDISAPGQGKNGRGIINEPGTTSALSAGEYTQQRMKGYYDKLGGQAAIGASFTDWLKQLRDVGQSIKFDGGDQGLWGA